MKIAVSSYSFKAAMQDERMGLMDVIPKAKAFGFEGVEIADVGDLGHEIRARADDLRRQSIEYGLPICAYLTSADFIENGVDAEARRLRAEVETTVRLGASMMRHDACWSVDPSMRFEDVLPELVDGYRRVTEFAAGLGVHTMIENHGFFVQDSARVKAVVAGVDHHNFGWLVDIGNFLCVDEDPLSAVAVAAPFAMHAHAKDFHIRPNSRPAPARGWLTTRGGNHLRGAIFGHGNMDTKGCIDILRRSGYDGWISLEFEGMEDCLMAIPEGLANLRADLQ